MRLLTLSSDEVLLGAAAWNDAVLDGAVSEVLERAGGKLLFSRRGAIAREFVQYTRELGRDENAEVLVGGVLGYFLRNEYLHLLPLRVFSDLALQIFEERFHPIGYLSTAGSLQRLRVDDAGNGLHRLVQIIVDYDVLVEI